MFMAANTLLPVACICLCYGRRIIRDRIQKISLRWVKEKAMVGEGSFGSVSQRLEHA